MHAMTTRFAIVGFVIAAAAVVANAATNVTGDVILPLRFNGLSLDDVLVSLVTAESLVIAR